MFEVKQEVPCLVDIKEEDEPECDFIEYYPEYSNIKSEDEEEYENKPPEENWDPTTGSGFPCRHCNLVFLLQSDFEKHAKKYKREICQFCWKDFSNRANLLEHISLHTGAKPYKCSTCKMEFVHRSNRDRHAKLHGDKPFHCEKCGGKFVSNSRLKEHMRHHGIRENEAKGKVRPRPFACEICDKRFMSQAHKKEHFRSHTQENDFICGICQKSFRFKSALTRHIKKQTCNDTKDFKVPKKTPFACHMCNKFYNSQSYLTQHMNSHNRLLYACDKCESTFTFKSNLLRHQTYRCKYEETISSE